MTSHVDKLRAHTNGERVFLESNMLTTSSGDIVRKVYSETDIDWFLYTGNSREAGYAIDYLLEQFDYENIVYSAQLFRILLKELATPLYTRAYYDDIQEPIELELSQDLEAIYGKSGELLRYLMSIEDDVPDINSLDASKAYVRGSMSELTFFMLFMRDIRGETTDNYTPLPASREQDTGVTQADGLRTGVDFNILQRDGDLIPLQVKTTVSVHKHYTANILVLSLEELVESRDAIPLLQQALIDEIDGKPFDDNLVYSAVQKLYDSVDSHVTLTYDSISPSY